MADYQEPKCVFAVVTWGAAASNWLALALNSHPKIYCSHALNGEWATATGQPRIDGLEFINALYYCFREYPACGDVHGLSRDTIPKIRSALGGRFGCAVIVREPVARLRSALSLALRQASTKAWGPLDYVLEFVNKGCPLPEDTYENRLTIHNINMLNSVIEESPLASVWRQEDITSNARKLRDFTTQLTNGVVQPSLKWAREAIAIPPTSSHTAKATPPPFSDWETEAIRRVVKPQAWQIYADLGYSLPTFL
jgi:hypothetical protein